MARGMSVMRALWMFHSSSIPAGSGLGGDRVVCTTPRRTLSKQRSARAPDPLVAAHPAR